MTETRRVLRVLLVGADVERASATLHRLMSNGHRPVLVEHSKAALERAKEQKFDLALIELGGRNSDARECARALSLEVPGLPLIGVVSRTEPFDRLEIAAFGACVMAPLDVNVLQKALAFVEHTRSAVSSAREESRSSAARVNHRSVRSLC